MLAAALRGASPLGPVPNGVVLPDRQHCCSHHQLVGVIVFMNGLLPWQTVLAMHSTPEVSAHHHQAMHQAIGALCSWEWPGNMLVLAGASLAHNSGVVAGPGAACLWAFMYALMCNPTHHAYSQHSVQ